MSWNKKNSDNEFQKEGSDSYISCNPQERKIVVDMTITNSGRRLDESEKTSKAILNLTLQQKNVLVDQDGQGLKEVAIWAISFQENLGKPAQ